MSAHQANVFSVELTEAEMAVAKSSSQSGVTHGVSEDTECTEVVVCTVADMQHRVVEVDWTTLGIVLSILAEGLRV